MVEVIKEVLKSSSELKFGALPYRKGEIMESKVENFALNEYGWSPAYSLEEAMRDYIME